VKAGNDLIDTNMHVLDIINCLSYLIFWSYYFKTSFKDY